MHCSRMRTGRSLAICQNLLPGGMSAPGGWGWGLLLGLSVSGGSALKGVCSQGGLLSRGSALKGVCSQGGLLSRGSALGDVCFPGGCLLPGVGVGSAPGGCLLSGVCSQGGSGIPACTEADPPPVNRITDTSKNITLATTSLRPVTIGKSRMPV